jgi:hypothetical protein
MSDRFGPIRRISERRKHMDSTSGTRPIGKTRLWIGRVMGGLVVAFLLFDSIPKILRMAWVVKATTELGFPAGAIQPIGVILLLCTVLYCIPRTAILGAILLTGYLGGAVEANVHAGLPLASHTLFPIYFAVFVWGSLALRDRRVWSIFARLRRDGRREGSA